MLSFNIFTGLARQRQQQVTETRGFPPPPHDGFGFGCLRLS